MIRKYLNRVLARMKSNPEPVHPHFSRAIRLTDGTLVEVDSFDDTDFDKTSPLNVVSITDILKSGDLPQKMGSSQPNAVLTGAEFASRFMAAFEAAGNVSTPSVDNSSVESSETVE